ncbi:uncharacterized protein LOC133887475 isoform X2 [Phragmites australis]|uniref:uncharacterized protein LOC133887475 isoform X2 n=1 Tax=Phragmites australis TaxID=29695 RepID=UPI002D774F39|nr:uncharacterized protein LOC133887475 isoform X2 [Phragmites australis]
MVKKKGSRSSDDGKPWKCGCGTVHKPTKYRFFNLQAFQCRNCHTKLALDFKFCLGKIEVDGKSLIGEVYDQDEERVERSLLDQSELDISKCNYILMVARGGQCRAPILRRLREEAKNSGYIRAEF